MNNYVIWKENHNALTISEKKTLIALAKEAYYNGTSFMSDLDYDTLEEECDVVNETEIGTEDTSYTVPHPFIMGSLSKVQIKENKQDKTIDWDGYTNDIKNYICRNSENPNLIITPKFDGCSFECVINKFGIITNISTRGNGTHGKDIYMHLKNKMSNAIDKFNSYGYSYCLRGEVLINKEVFNDKYGDFVNPRSFVSGILNRKYEDIEDKSVIDDLSIVIYDIRRKENGVWIDKDWNTYIGSVKYLPEYFATITFNKFNLKTIYEVFDSYRKSSPYALDGIVIKPTEDIRENNLSNKRPKDCVAVKFLPMINETTVDHIEWQLGKSGEYTPVVVYDTFKLDGKDMTRATAFNYGFVKRHNICKGTKIRVSLAGDIIPFIYDVISSPTDNAEIEIPDGSYVDGCHLMKELSKEEKACIDFIASAKVLNIRGLGEKQAKIMFDGLIKSFDLRYHIFQVNDSEFEKIFIDKKGNFSKNGQNILGAWKRKKESATLAEIIQSCNFTDCGENTSKQIERYILEKESNVLTPSYDFSGLSRIGYEWVFNENSVEYTYLTALLRVMNEVEVGFEFSKYVVLFNESRENPTFVGLTTKVILTGSPTQYKTKKEFLTAHPEYVETTKWNECQILFTGDLNSTSSKMVKAKKLGIEIKEY